MTGDPGLYVATLHQLICFGALSASVVLLASLGTLLTGPAATPELRLIVGWGATCLVLTIWAVATPFSLRLPVIVLGVLALARLRSTMAAVAELWRLGVLAIPLLLVVLPLRPSQPDTWLNLLPNAAYLFDHGMLPGDDRPPSFSFLPAAPYNTQFIAFIASLVAGRFAETAMGLFNVLLLLAAGGLLGRVVSADTSGARKPLSWPAAAVGFLLAVPLNPGFIPRSFFAPYGEAPLAVTVLFAIWVGASLIRDVLNGTPIARRAFALAAVLTALVNIKQSAIGLLLACVVSTLIVGAVHPRMPRVRWTVTIMLSAAPALLLYAGWRWYALSHFVLGELKPLPLAQWHIALLPEILAAIGNEMTRRFTYFLVIGVVLAATATGIRKRPWDEVTITLGIVAGTILLFSGFLVFTYVAHFPTDWAIHAHSFFRYMSQVSLITVLGLVVRFRAEATAWLARSAPNLQRTASGLAITLMILLPAAFLPMLRFDLESPQPTVWELAKEVGGKLADGDKLALVLPGDEDDIAGSMMRGVIMFTPPRRTGLTFRAEHQASTETLSALAAEGYRHAFIGCVPPGGLAGAPAGVAAMLAFDDGVWRADAVWYYPTGLAARHHWSALLPREAFCGGAPVANAGK